MALSIFGSGRHRVEKCMLEETRSDASLKVLDPNIRLLWLMKGTCDQTLIKISDSYDRS